MSEVELSAGTIEYEDTGGGGPVVVLLHGLVMDGSLWRHVVADLRSDYRCVVPTLPLGGHRRPMRPDADLSPHGIAWLVAEFLERLDLREVTLVQNDHGAALVLAGERPERIARLVLVSCEAFDNYPPGLPGKTVALVARLPGGLNALAVLDAGRAAGQVLTQREIRRDLIKYVRTGTKRDMIEATERLRSFDRPALVIWAAEDRVMPLDHGRRLAQLLPRGQLVEISDSYTLIPEDQPAELARALRDFLAAEAGAQA